MYFKPWIRLPVVLFSFCSTMNFLALTNSCFHLFSSEHSQRPENVHHAIWGNQRAERWLGNQVPWLPYYICKSLFFNGQSEVLTPNPHNVKAIYISHYSCTFSTTEQPTTGVCKAVLSSHTFSSIFHLTFPCLCD